MPAKSGERICVSERMYVYWLQRDGLYVCECVQVRLAQWTSETYIETRVLAMIKDKYPNIPRYY